MVPEVFNSLFGQNPAENNTFQPREDFFMGNSTEEEFNHTASWANSAKVADYSSVMKIGFVIMVIGIVGNATVFMVTLCCRYVRTCRVFFYSERMGIPYCMTSAFN